MVHMLQGLMVLESNSVPTHLLIKPSLQWLSVYRSWTRSLYTTLLCCVSDYLSNDLPMGRDWWELTSVIILELDRGHSEIAWKEA